MMAISPQYQLDLVLRAHVACRRKKSFDDEINLNSSRVRSHTSSSASAPRPKLGLVELLTMCACVSSILERLGHRTPHTTIQCLEIPETRDEICTPSRVTMTESFKQKGPCH